MLEVGSSTYDRDNEEYNATVCCHQGKEHMKPNTTTDGPSSPIQRPQKAGYEGGSTTEGSISDVSKEVNDCLTGIVPGDLKYSLPDGPTIEKTERLIQEHNDKMLLILKDAELVAVWAFVKNEVERTKRQKPLLFIVAGFTFLQLLAFNLVVAVCAWRIISTAELDIIAQVIDLVRYYIGATVVELIAMLLYIVTGTFATHHIKTMDALLNKTRWHGPQEPKG